MRQLDRLARLARAVKRDPSGFQANGVADDPIEAGNAMRHGSAAVRAIYSVPIAPDGGADEPIFAMTLTAHRAAVSEARLAVRAALRACGITGSL
jgi:hypothetical protein